jgi:hypothetical protein
MARRAIAAIRNDLAWILVFCRRRSLPCGFQKPKAGPASVPGVEFSDLFSLAVETQIPQQKSKAPFLG